MKIKTWRVEGRYRSKKNDKKVRIESEDSKEKWYINRREGG